MEASPMSAADKARAIRVTFEAAQANITAAYVHLTGDDPGRAAEEVEAAIRGLEDALSALGALRMRR
jgi:hypothetical protein